MTISGISRLYKINWRTIKNYEKIYLGKKYKRKKLKNVRVIGIDEIYICPKKKKYITIVRDLETGAVLHIGKGKGKDALKDLKKRLACSKAKIKTIAMDMSGPFKSWAKEVLPKATIVFDHFHVIKLMNDKIDTLRRSTMNKLDDEQKKH